MNHKPPDPEVTVIDDILSNHYADYIDNFFREPFADKEHNNYWRYLPTIDIQPSPKHKNAKGNSKGGFVNQVFDTYTKGSKRAGKPLANEPLCNLLMPILYQGLGHYKPDDILDGVYRVRAVMYCRGMNTGTGVPHRDLFIPHSTMIYYVHDSDGPTLIYNSSMEVVNEVEPKKNRAVFFEGTTYHASSYPEEHHNRTLIFYYYIMAAR